MVSSVAFGVLGPVVVTAGDRTESVRSDYQRTLLAMLLAAPNRVVSIDRLVDVLWGVDDWDRGQRRLWFHVSKLRNRLPPDVAIERVRSGYVLVVDESTIDASRFETAAGQVRELAVFDPVQASAAAGDALRLWRGDAYEDVAEEAVGLAERVRLEEMRLSTLELRCELDVHEGRHELVVADLEKLVRDHPYRERLRFLHMTALRQSGRSAEALLAFDDAERVFSRVPGFGSGELATLARRIRAARGGAGAGPVGRPAAEIYSQAPFAGRDAELAALRGVVADPTRTGPAVRFVQGQAGAGKTALLERLIEEAEIAIGGLVALKIGGHAETGPDEPYGLVRRLLASSSHRSNVQRLTTAEGQRRLIDLGEPPWAVAQALRSLAEAGAGQGEREDRLVHGLHELVARAPTLVVVDDLQWVDRPSLRVVRRLVEQGPSQLVFIAGYRPEEVDRRPGLVDQVADFQTMSSSSVVVDLDDLGPDGQRAFVDALTDREPNDLDDEFRSALTEHSEGNALYATELLEQFVRDGSLVRVDGRWHRADSLAWSRWPVRLHAVLSARFRALDHDAVRVLQAASVEGAEFTELVVADVAEMDRETVGHLLAGELLEARIVAPSDDRHGADPLVRRFRFRHALFQRFFYEELDRRDRVVLHRRVADALVQLWSGPQRDEGAVEIARHYELGGAADRAIEYWSRAAASAIRLSANDLAARHVERALALLAELPDLDRRRTTQAELLLQLGAAQAVAFGFSSPETMASYDRASALLADTSAEQRMAAVFGVWVSACTRANFERSNRLVDELTSLADEVDDDLHRVTALHACWTEALFRGRLHRCIEAAERGRALYRLADHPPALLYGNHDPAVCARSLGGLAISLSGGTERGARWLDEGVRLAEVIGHRASLAQASAITAWAAQLRGDRRAAREAADRALAPSQPSAPIWQGVARAMRAWSTLGNDLEPDTEASAVTALRRELEMQTANGNFAWTPMYATLLSEILIRRGQVEEAGELLSDREMANAGGFYRAEVLRLRGEVVAERGSSAATSLFEAACDEAAEAGALVFELRAAMSHYSVDEAARPRLSEVIGRLPPGHRSTDHDEARRLLDW